jgi:hypothetical protein
VLTRQKLLSSPLIMQKSRYNKHIKALRSDFSPRVTAPYVGVMRQSVQDLHPYFYEGFL